MLPSRLRKMLFLRVQVVKTIKRRRLNIGTMTAGKSSLYLTQDEGNSKFFLKSTKDDTKRRTHH